MTNVRSINKTVEVFLSGQYDYINLFHKHESVPLGKRPELNQSSSWIWCHTKVSVPLGLIIGFCSSFD